MEIESLARSSPIIRQSFKKPIGTLEADMLGTRKVHFTFNKVPTLSD